MENSLMADVDFYLRYTLPPQTEHELLQYVERAADLNNCRVEDVIIVLAALIIEAKGNGMTLRAYVYDGWDTYIRQAYWDDQFGSIQP